MKRKALSKKLRFTVFARDGFACQYCGRTPPAVILHCDHVVPVVDGGPDTEDNLITSCQECNLGKGRDPAQQPKRPAVPERTEEIREAEEQLAAYRELLQQRDSRINAAIDEVDEHFNALTDGEFYLTERGRRSVRQWLRDWTVEDLKEAFGIAADQGKLEKYWFMAYIGGILRKWRTEGRR